MAHISAFVSVASQLILIKSRAILPRPPLVAIPVEEGPDPEAALRERLILYRIFRDAGRGPARPPGERLGGLPAGARRCRRLGAGGLATRRGPAARGAAALRGARGRPAPGAGPPPPPEVVPRLVTLEERAALIRAALREAPVVVLQDLLEDLGDRVVVAVTFLAMLELVKGRELIVVQDEPFGPIVCRSRSAA